MHSLCTQRLGTDCWWQQVGCTLRPGPEHVCRARAQNPVTVGRIPGIPRYSTRVGVEYAVCPARKCLFREFSRPATSVADGRALQPGNLTQSKCRSALVTTVRSPLAGVRCPAHHSPLTARSHALRAAKQLAEHRSVPVAPAGSASLASGVPPFPNASDQKLASYVVVASDQSLIDSRRSPGATRHLPRPSPRMRSRLLHPRSHHHRRRRRRRRRRGALRGS